MSKSAQTERSSHACHGATDRQVLQIASRVSSALGTRFFASMVERLSEVLKADCVYIGEFLGGQTERVKTLSAWLDHRPDCFEYELAGSASAQPALGKPCLCRAHARGRFPADTVLAQLGAEACVEIPLLSPRGDPLGVIVAAYRQRIASTDAPKDLLEIFASRAASELDRKQLEGQLRQSEQRHRAFIALNSDAMGRIEFDHPISTALPEQQQLDRIYRDGYLAECNDALAHLLGFEKAEELIGRRIVDLTPLSNASVRNATLYAIRSGYRFNRVETSPLGRDGKPRYMLRSQWGIVEDGMLRRIWGTIRDITELKLSEMKLDALEQRMSDLLENLPLMVVLLHPDGEIAFCNSHFFHSTGWQAPDVEGKDWVDLMMPPEERARVHAAIQTGHTDARRPVHFESPLLGPKGDRRWVAWDSTILRDSTGNACATVNVGRDITDFKTLEASFYQAQKLESVGRLAGGLGRDFNNLLTIIKSRCDTILKKGSLSESAQADLQEIRKAAEKGSELTQRLLAFGCRRVNRPEVLNLTDVIARDERFVRQLIGEQIRLVFNLHPALELVRADAGCFDQIVLNLIVNARDAMPDGGTLTVATNNVEIPAGSAATAPNPLGLAPAKYVQLTVTDTGTGMNSEVRGHMFEPFFTTKPRGKGTGLGLSTVYGNVRQSAGRIAVETELGKGTTVRIFLPAVSSGATLLEHHAEGGN